jgi:hypothetical protein
MEYAIILSMSRKWDYYNIAGMGSFFATLERELVVLENFLTKKEAKAKIFKYIKVFLLSATATLDSRQPQPRRVRRGKQSVLTNRTLFQRKANLGDHGIEEFQGSSQFYHNRTRRQRI